MQKTVVELEGVNGEWFTLAGPQAGDKGVYLATGVSGLFDPPVKASYEEPGNYPGARYLSHRVLRRDLVFAVHILEDGESWLSRDSEWRKAWAFDRDCKLHVTTQDSGTRYLKVRLFEQMDVDTETDPNGRTLTTVKMITTAGDPFWYGDDVVYSAVTKTDTTFNPYNWGWPWPPVPVEDLYIDVDPSDGKGGLNPTDQYIFPKWTVPGSPFAPAFPVIPGTEWTGGRKSKVSIWTLPDYSFEDSTKADRRLKLPGLIGGLRTDEVQAYNLDGIVEGGTYKLKMGNEVSIGDLAWNANIFQIKTAVETFSQVAYDDVVVTRGKPTNEIQTIELDGTTGGTFTLSFAGQTTQPIPYNCSNAQLFNALRALPAITLFDLKITSKVTNEVQIVTPVGEPKDGTFTLTFDGQTTGPIPWDANALKVYSELTKLPNLGLLDVTVTQKEWWKPYSPWVVSFNGLAGTYKGINVPTMTADADALEGGHGMDIVVSTEVQGSRPYVVQFRGLRGGQNVPELVANVGGLTGPAPQVHVRQDHPGAFPYILSFRNGCSGKSLPLIEVITDKLTGPGERGYRAWKITEGSTAPAENCVIDTDPRTEQIVSESGSAIWARMNGVRFRHPIPPWTKSKKFKISVSGTPPGQMVSLRLPRPWSRPWGLE